MKFHVYWFDFQRMFNYKWQANNLLNDSECYWVVLNNAKK